MSSTVAVLGAGIQGCLTALSLAKRGIHVHLYDKSSDCMTGASLWNEGKIHLGFVYANDSSFETARLMARAAFRFLPIIEELCELRVAEQDFSEPFIYARHKESLLSAEQLERHYAQVEQYVTEEALSKSGRYPGYEEGGCFHRLSATEVSHYYSEDITHAWATAERSIDPASLAHYIRSAVKNAKRIECRFDCEVCSLAHADKGKYSLRLVHMDVRDQYDAVVNATWESRLHLDLSLGIQPPQDFSLRYKCALFGEVQTEAPSVCSTTIVLGPFGDIVHYSKGKCYLSWYPLGCTHISHKPGPPRWDLTTTEESRKEIARGIVAELCKIFRGFSHYAPQPEALTIGGGAIYSRGLANIKDLDCQVHERYQVGVAKHGNYYSIDTGKLTTAPLFAEQASHMIVNNLF